MVSSSRLLQGTCRLALRQQRLHGRSSLYFGHVEFQRRSMSSIMKSANELLNNLRLTAAKTLTASLGEDERDALLKKYQNEGATKDEPNSSENSPHVNVRSIAEAQAAAQFDELLNEKKAQLQRETDQLRAKAEANAEKAARARVENELAIKQRQMAFAKWEEQVAEAKQKKESGEAVAPIMTVADVISVPSTVAEAVPVEQQQQEEEHPALVHPILGKVLADLGSKRAYLVSAKNLATIGVWKKQRTYRHNRAKEMVADKLKTLHLGLPGVITMFEDSEGQLSIVDGQHRVGMLNLLLEKAGTNDFDFDNILVEVYSVNTSNINGSPPKKGDDDAIAQALFLEVNKAQPVKLVDLPGMAKASHRKIINETAAHFEELFPEMFKPSQRCRPPHLNIDNLRDALFASDIIGRHAIKSSKGLQDWIMAQNELLRKKYSIASNKKQVTTKTLEKAANNHFFLGVDTTWYSN